MLPGSRVNWHRLIILIALWQKLSLALFNWYMHIYRAKEKRRLYRTQTNAHFIFVE